MLKCYLHHFVKSGITVNVFLCLIWSEIKLSHVTIHRLLFLHQFSVLPFLQANLHTNETFQIYHRLQAILSRIGIYWGSLNESQTSEQSLYRLSGIPLSTLTLAAMFRFIWADIRPENDLSSQRSLPSHFVGVWTSWAPLYSLAG